MGTPARHPAQPVKRTVVERVRKQEIRHIPASTGGGHTIETTDDGGSTIVPLTPRTNLLFDITAAPIHFTVFDYAPLDAQIFGIASSVLYNDEQPTSAPFSSLGAGVTAAGVVVERAFMSAPTGTIFVCVHVSAHIDDWSLFTGSLGVMPLTVTGVDGSTIGLTPHSGGPIMGPVPLGPASPPAFMRMVTTTEVVLDYPVAYPALGGIDLDCVLTYAAQ